MSKGSYKAQTQGTYLTIFGSMAPRSGKTSHAGKYLTIYGTYADRTGQKGHLLTRPGPKPLPLGHVKFNQARKLQREKGFASPRYRH